MLRYNYRDVVGISSKVKTEHKYDDVVEELLNHLSYQNIENIDLENLESLQFVRECDYCGESLLYINKGYEYGRVGQSYIDENSEYPSTDDCCGRKECKNIKRMLTTWQRHGVEHAFQIDEVIEKRNKAREEQGYIPVSRQQQYIANLLNADVNIHFKHIGYIDIILEDEKLIIEYDGGGHYVGIHFGHYTYEEKLQMDYERDLKMRSLGYKVIRIESLSDYLPSDEVILAKINDIKKHFSNSEKEFFKWIIPKSKKDKRYGKLREITKDDLS